jgi:hypothetical protein
VFETRNPARSQGRNIQPIGYSAGLKPAGGAANVLKVQVAAALRSPGNDECGTPIPRQGVAVAINVAGVDVAAGGWIRVWDCSTPQPPTSNVNLEVLPPGTRAPAGVDADARANLVITGMDPEGNVCIVSLTSMEVFVDLIGYFPVGSPYRPLAPKRVVESRPQFPDLYNTARPQPNVAVELPLERNGATITSGSKFVALNVTGETPDTDGTLRVYDCAAGPATAQVIALDRTVDATPQLVIAKVNATKTICAVSTTAVSLIVDLFGEFGTRSLFTTFATPVTIFDGTVPRSSGTAGTAFQISGTPAFGGAAVDAAYIKITANATAERVNGFVRVHPCLAGAPSTSSVNVAQYGPPADDFPPAANVVFAQTNDTGAMCVYAQQNADVKIEAYGFWPIVPRRARLTS